MGDQDTPIRVKVTQPPATNLHRVEGTKIKSSDRATEETSELVSYDIPADSSYQHHRPHVQLLQERFLRGSDGNERDSHVGSNNALY